MVELNKAFSINDVVIDRNDEDKDFAIVELWALAEGSNSHRNPISKEVLRRDAHTFKGKFIIGKYDNFIKDTKGHEIKEDVYGYVSVTEEPQFKKKTVDNVEKEFVVVKGVLSKIYAKQIVDLFRVNNVKSVSCEFSCALEYEEDEYGRPLDENGLPMDIDNPILAYSISGITILGERINPSVKGAEIIMKRFSEDTNKLSEKFKLKELKTTSKEDNMEENKNLSEQPKDENEDIVMEEVKEFPKDKEKDKEEKVEDEVAEMANETETEEKEMSCGESKEMEREEPTEEKEMSEVEETKEETTVEFEEDEKVEDKKTFSEQCVEFSDEEHKEFVEKLFSCELKDMVEQIIELKKFMETTVKANTEKRFSEIMVEPKLCLGEKAYNVLFEEGKTLSLNELDAFETKVKAFCEDAPKKQEEASDNELMKFACGEDTNNNVEQNLDVWSRIANY